jgi:hypothetical protein
MDYLADQHRLKPEELSIKSSDESHRLSQHKLEEHWRKTTEEDSMRWPFWAHRDETLQQIICASLQSVLCVSHASGNNSPRSVFTEDIPDDTTQTPSTPRTELGSDVRPPHPLSDQGEDKVEREPSSEAPLNPSHQFLVTPSRR